MHKKYKIRSKGEPDIHLSVDFAGNLTTVVILVGEPPYSKPAQLRYNGRTIFGGMSFCNPKDTWNEWIGIKIACADALDVGKRSWNRRVDPEISRPIYRRIRAFFSNQKE